MSWLTELAEKIKERRNALGLSQQELARRASTIQAQISNLENGKTQPSMDLLYRIASALKVHVRDLIPDNLPGDGVSSKSDGATG